uniref:NADH-ubiquinone oxidoreductase chain 6 n=1 Tax=Nerita chamaeleon TaxID=335532 RepID=A0A8H2SNY3_9GAST|nr:NADH dehydrogenase subunit 6 [Nerita histrio]QWS05787.1 NADH dehydrogenase subunit 6 [Nerita chamaeleon]UYI29943.1 NADH dehydrogenase subunit 6 [Nerita histrio]
MTVCIITSLLLALIFSMPMMMQPLSLGLCIMMISLFWCILLGLTYSSWFSYVLFLIYVGGLLVMFVYVAALAPNTLFSSLKSLSGIMMVSTFMLILSIALTPKDLSFLSDISSLDHFSENMKTGILMVSSSNISMLIGLGLILLMNLLAVVKVCYYQQGPLRPYNELT